MKQVLLSILLAVSASAASSEPVAVFGLPLGGKLKSMPKVCPSSAIGNDKSTLLCWIDTPFVYPPTGSRSGAIKLPNEYAFPQWAAFGMFRGRVSRKGVLEELEVRSASSRSAEEVTRSIESRFGAPTASRLHGSGMSSAEWNRPDISIMMRCDGRDYCYVTFRSAAAKADYDREMEQRRQQEARRSVSP